MYTLLTGLNPFYDSKSTKEVIQQVQAGKTAYIDPRWKERSSAEATLAELIPQCFEYKPQNRISIFELVDHLKKAVNELLQDGITRESVLHGINAT
jgi:serine/threonine protein kinase